MKILLIGNYINLRQQSMQRFAEMLRKGLMAASHEVRLVHPPVWLGRLWPRENGLGKWIGYIDRFLLYPPLLRRQMRWADVVHICDQVNVVYIPHLRGKPHVVTCHDMLAVRAARGEIPELLVGWMGRIYQRWISINLEKARCIVCVSRHTSEDVQRIAGVADDRLAVVPNALNYPYGKMLSNEVDTHLSALRLSNSRPFFLHVGDNSWYKNRPGVLRLFGELVKRPVYQEHCLVMAGKPWTDEMRQMVSSLDLQDHVIECVEVSNEQLHALYSAAEALLFPSLQEGFGWPIVEAQACGCPVVTTERPPMTEVGGDAAIYIDPADAAGAARRIAEGLADPARWRTAGLKNAARFSTEAMIEGYLRCYDSVLQHRNGSSKKGKEAFCVRNSGDLLL